MVALAAALLASAAGCASQVSDKEIVAALGGGGGTTSVPGGPAAPGADAATATVALPAANSAAGSAAAPQRAAAGAAAQAGTTTGAGGDASSAGAAKAQGLQPAPSGLRPVPLSPAKVPAKDSGSQPAPSTPRAATLSPVRVGVLGVFSGVLGAITEGGPKTVSAWAAYTNAHGGLNGHPINVIVGDDQGDPATSLTLAKRMVESDKIIAMVGNVNVFGFGQLDKYMTEKKIPLIGGDGVDPGWFTSTNTFPVSAPAATQIIKGLKSYVDSGTKKIAILYCLEVSSLCTYLTDQAKKSEVGQYILQSYQVSLVAPSYTSQCVRMQQAGIEMMYLLMDTAGAARAVQNCATQGFRPKTMLLGLDATKDLPTTSALIDATVPGAVASPAAPGIPSIAKYLQVMAAYAPAVGQSGVGLQAWASAEMLGLVGKNLPANPTAADLYAALYKVKDETLGGMIVPVSYIPGKPAQVKSCMFLWAVKDKKFSAPNGTKPSC
jgi:branched-chain amino acid transport system substrate-binding protein